MLQTMALSLLPLATIYPKEVQAVLVEILQAEAVNRNLLLTCVLGLIATQEPAPTVSVIVRGQVIQGIIVKLLPAQPG